jgi:hypothetical protein
VADALTLSPDIANPVALFNDMHHEVVSKGIELSPATSPEVNIQTEGHIDYIPRLGTIIKKAPMTK